MTDASFVSIDGDYSKGVEREWLAANGLGGYASSTSVGANTRSYHGLLIAAIDPPCDRRLLLSSLDEEMIGAETFLLANHQYPGAIYPRGFLHLQHFALDPFPRFLYRVGGAFVEKLILPVYGENTTLVRYRISGWTGLFRLIPLVTCRSFHHASSISTVRSSLIPGGGRFSFEDPLVELFLISDRAGFSVDPQRYMNMEYEEERRRGLSWREDLHSPGRFEVHLDGGDEEFTICASTCRRELPEVQAALADRMNRMSSISSPVPKLGDAADSFIVRRAQGWSIIAGYHWFNDWGRDTMISLPGLMLTTRRFKEAREILRTYADSMRGGVLPNDLGCGCYNTVDASLWFVRAVREYISYTGDLEFASSIYPSLLEVMAAYRGENEFFKMDHDWLITAQAGMTWMDARVNGVCVTPRGGKACEINALWYAANRFMAEMAAMLDLPWDEKPASRIKRSFRRFWNEDAGCLHDTIDPVDSSVRPNQVIAAAFSNDLIGQKRRDQILSLAEDCLLTPYGLRTLSPNEPGYVGRYEGGPVERDKAYHQGTVWPWLIGPYVSARRKAGTVGGRLAAVLSPLIADDRAGICTISEVYDGDVPHRPNGCISQAWSVGEVLRAWREDVEGVRPSSKR